MLPHIVPFSFGESPINTGRTTQVTCLVSEGDVPLKFSWKFNQNPIDLRTSLSTMKIGAKGSLLLIDAVNEENAGNYTCQVSNFAGVTEYTTSLDVYGDCFFYFSGAIWRISFLLYFVMVFNYSSLTTFILRSKLIDLKGILTIIFPQHKFLLLH